MLSPYSKMDTESSKGSYNYDNYIIKFLSLRRDTVKYKYKIVNNNGCPEEKKIILKTRILYSQVVVGW